MEDVLLPLDVRCVHSFTERCEMWDAVRWEMGDVRR